MQKSNETQAAPRAHRQTKASTTLNRKYVKRPAQTTTTRPVVKRSPMVSHFAKQAPRTTVAKAPQTLPTSKPIAPAQTHPIQSTANARMRQRTTTVAPAKPTAQQLKDQAIKKALASASTMSTSGEQAIENDKKLNSKHHFGVGRVVLALTCAAAAVFAIVYFVNLNMPDISLKVAAMQTGIEATYPSYVPRDFGLSGIVSESGKITLNFANHASGDEFSLVEEKSSWDSNALLNNFVKDEYGDNYSTIREQGLTIYVSDSNAAWVNGGIVYKLNTTTGTLTKKQISSIAASL